MLFLPFSSFAFNVSLVVTTSGSEGEILKDIFQETLIEKGLNVVVRTDLSLVLDEREKISLKAFKGETLKDLKASDILIVLNFFLLDRGTYNVVSKAVNIANGVIILIKNYEIPSLSLRHLNKIANDFVENLLKFLDYSQFSKKAFEIQLLDDQRSGPQILKIRGMRNGWIKIFRSEKNFIELLYEFQVLTGETQDFLIGDSGKNVELKILWLPRYITLSSLEISELEIQLKKRGIEDWYMKSIKF